ncbi:Flp pilus assembly protein TadG [Phycicoccus badiiscoriae]|uniref:Flp pilus assembly protein TadG n=1 Tax=Pedococcus badiiscoriae TaxID=642776 RepID=A0A852WJ89_9MICO|nr:Flp pilus assembly protein TadG [Pedococcus badiiscoriae]
MAVETAFVSMLLLTILYSIVETSFLMRDGIVVSAASRAGARMASSLPRDPSFSSSAKDQVANALSGMVMSRVTKVWIFKADATTALPDSGNYTSCTTCNKYVWDVPTSKFVASYTGWAALNQNACQGSQDQLGVLVEYSYPSRLGFLWNNKVLREATVMRLEPYTGIGVCK